MVYREQKYVERGELAVKLRCYCDAPAVVYCVTCRRARCAQHVVRDLCSRCSVAIQRELAADTNARWLLSGIAGVAFFFSMAALRLLGLSFVGLPLAIAVAGALYQLQRARLIRKMAPRLAALVGELPPAPSGSPFPEEDERFFR